MTLTQFLEKFEFMTSDKPNLNAMNYFMEKLDYPNKKLKFIHVAGTNGKGSICEMLSSILISSNYTVGKFISPYLLTANESICVNGKHFSKNDEENYISIMENLITEYVKDYNAKPSRFEVQTTLALLYFLDKKCDIVILEVGLGGRYDCTNIITSPITACFGNISYDHTNILGNTLEEITMQKAGIIKENSNAIIFENEKVISVLESVAREKNSNLIVCKNEDIENYKLLNDNADNQIFQVFDYKQYKDIMINLKGKKQIQNTCVVLETINILKENKFEISDNNIKHSLKQIVHPGRFEIVNKSPLTIFDGAHNEDALENFIETVKSIYSNKTFTFIVSQITTKDYKKFISKLLSEFPASNFIFTSGTGEKKFFDKNILYNYAIEFLKKNSNNNHNKYDSNFFANISNSDFELAIENLNSEVNFIIGSFYTYKKVCEILK